LREGQAGRGRTAKKPTPVEGDGWHRRKTPRKCTGRRHATQAGKARLMPSFYPGKAPRSTATPAPDSVEPGNGPVQSGCVADPQQVRNQQNRCQRADTAEAEDGRQDGQPEQS